MCIGLEVRESSTQSDYVTLLLVYMMCGMCLKYMNCESNSSIKRVTCSYELNAGVCPKALIQKMREMCPETRRLHRLSPIMY